jgi:hypothetical protein
METNEALRDIMKVRLRFHMNNRLRLECLAALSKTFREYGEAISDELLASIVPAIPEELPGESSSASPYNPNPSNFRSGKPPTGDGGGTPPAGKPPTGKPPTGMPPTGTPPTGTPPTGKPPTGKPPTGTPPTGTPPTGTPPTGKPPVGKPPTGRPPTGTPPGGGPKKKKRGRTKR